MKSRTVDICETAAQIIVAEARRGVAESRCPEHLAGPVERRLMACATISVSDLKEGVSFDYIQKTARRAVRAFDTEAFIERLDARSRSTPTSPPTPKLSYRNHVHGDAGSYWRKPVRGTVIA